jgi:hypothetical protein
MDNLRFLPVAILRKKCELFSLHLVRTSSFNNIFLFHDNTWMTIIFQDLPVTQLRLWPFSVRANQSLRPFVMDFQMPIMVCNMYNYIPRMNVHGGYYGLVIIPPPCP